MHVNHTKWGPQLYLVVLKNTSKEGRPGTAEHVAGSRSTLCNITDVIVALMMVYCMVGP